MKKNSAQKINHSLDTEIIEFVQATNVNISKFNRYETRLKELNLLHIANSACETPEYRSLQHCIIVHQEL